jgi:hypothetical protein
MKKFFNIVLICAICYGIYFVLKETQIISKIECLTVGGTPVLSSEVGPKTVNPKVVCAEPTTDANKECYDSRECSGDCILERYSDGYNHVGDFITAHGRDKRGYCQPYKEMDCYVTRDISGTIILRKCDSEQ